MQFALRYNKITFVDFIIGVWIRRVSLRRHFTRPSAPKYKRTGLASFMPFQKNNTRSATLLPAATFLITAQKHWGSFWKSVHRLSPGAMTTNPQAGHSVPITKLPAVKLTIWLGSSVKQVKGLSIWNGLYLRNLERDVLGFQPLGARTAIGPV